MKFGSIFVNQFTSENDPHRISILVRDDESYYHCTDGKGSFWRIDKITSNIKIVDSLDLSPFSEAIARDSVFDDGYDGSD